MHRRLGAPRVLMVALVVSLALLPLAAPAAADGRLDPGDLASFFDARMAEYLEAYRIPGAALAVVQDGDVLLTRGYGVADVEAQTPVDPETTPFRIASITKLFTWTAVMQLVEQGALDLDADVNGYLTGVRVPATYPRPITLAHLMAHTAGFEDRGIATLASGPETATPLADYLARHMPARVRPPGVVSMYSNYGAALAGLIVAQASGMPYEEYIARHILEPLGMAHSSALQPPPEPLAARLAHSYAYVGGGYRATSYAIDLAGPAGGMSASAADMARFMLAHLGDADGGARLLDAAVLREMHTQSFTHHPSLPGWAHGFREMDVNGRRAQFHDGALQGYVSLLLLLPEENLGLFVAFNASGGGIAVDELVRGFFDRYYPDEPVPVALDEPMAGAAERARPLVGHYRSAQRPYTTIEVLTHDAPVAPLTAAADGTLRFLGWRWVEVEPLLYRSTSSDDVLAFFTDERGRVTGAALGSSALDRVRWHERSGARLGLLAICLAVLLSAVLGWVGAALSRRPRRIERWPRLARAARWLAGGAAVLAIVDLAALVTTLSSAPLIYGVPPILRVLTTIPYGIAALTLGVLAFAAVAWRRKLWTASGRVHYALVGLALVGVLFVMAVYNVLGPHLG